MYRLYFSQLKSINFTLYSSMPFRPLIFSKICSSFKINKNQSIKIFTSNYMILIAFGYVGKILCLSKSIKTTKTFSLFLYFTLRFLFRHYLRWILGWGSY